MAQNTVGKRVVAQIIQKRAQERADTPKSARCNFFTARASADEVLVSFGERGGSAQPGGKATSIHHEVRLTRAIARRLGDTLAQMLKGPVTQRVRVTARPTSKTK